jgi:hypothetical protein
MQILGMHRLTVDSQIDLRPKAFVRSRYSMPHRLWWGLGDSSPPQEDWDATCAFVVAKGVAASNALVLLKV